MVMPLAEFLRRVANRLDGKDSAKGDVCITVRVDSKDACEALDEIRRKVGESLNVMARLNNALADREGGSRRE